MEVEAKVLQFCLRLERIKVKLFLEYVATQNEKPKYYSLPSSSHKTYYYVNEIKLLKHVKISHVLAYLLLDIDKFNSVASPGTIQFISCNFLCFSC